MDSQKSEGDRLEFSERVVQILVADIRASLEKQLDSEEVSRAFQETSDRLARRLELPKTSLSESVRGQLSALIVDMRLW